MSDNPQTTKDDLIKLMYALILKLNAEIKGMRAFNG